MKKVIITCALALVLCLALTACMDSSVISANSIKDIALRLVGATMSDADYAVIATNDANSQTVEFAIDGVQYEATLSGSEAVRLSINGHDVDPNEIPPRPTQSTQYISKEEAASIALADAGFSGENAPRVAVGFDFDDGMYLYEVEFVLHGQEYEYDIVAKNGTIHEKSVEGRIAIVPTIKDRVLLSPEAIRENVLSALALTDKESDIIAYREKLEYEHGLYIYEVELTTNDNEYECTVHAETGEVLRIEREGAPAPAELNEVDRIKQVALAHAGLLQSEVVFTEIEVETKRGVRVYCIEFETATHEYEMEIQADTGAVLDYEKENRD